MYISTHILVHVGRCNFSSHCHIIPTVISIMMVIDDSGIQEAVKNYKELNAYVEDALTKYVINMAAQLGVKVNGSVPVKNTKTWSELIQDGDELATKAWCFAIEYIPNKMEAVDNKGLSHQIVQGFIEEHRVDRHTVTCCKTGKSTKLFNKLTDAFMHIFQAIRKRWRRASDKNTGNI